MATYPLLAAEWDVDTAEDQHCPKDPQHLITRATNVPVTSPRKRRLIAHGLCAQLLSLPTINLRMKNFIELIEFIADKPIARDGLVAAQSVALRFEEEHDTREEWVSDTARSVSLALDSEIQNTLARVAAHVRSALLAYRVHRRSSIVSIHDWGMWGKHSNAISAQLNGAIRDVLGNPFRSVTIDPAWRTWNDGTVVKVAKSIYEERAFDQMPILADALEEAGCMDEKILHHCRTLQAHYRGCWIVDEILGQK